MLRTLDENDAHWFQYVASINNHRLKYLINHEPILIMDGDSSNLSFFILDTLCYLQLIPDSVLSHIIH